MKKQVTRFIKALTLLLLMMVCLQAKVNAQRHYSPQASSDFLISIGNDAQTDNKTLEFDVFVLDTDPANVFEMATIQAGITINSAVYNGGTITMSIVPGTSTLLSAQQPANVNWVQSQNCMKLAPRTPPGAGNGTTLSTTSPGNRVCRLRVTNSVAFAQQRPNLTFSFTTVPYPTKINQYIAGINTGLTTSATNCVSNCINFILNSGPSPFNVTGTGAYCADGTGLTVGLSGSEIGVNYQLYQNTVSTGTPVAGTGAALTWTNQTAGTYTVVGTITATSITGNMTGSAIITTNPVSVGGTITPATTTISLGASTGTLTLAGNTGTVVKWQRQFNGGGFVDVANTLLTYSEVPAAAGTYDYQAVVQSGICATATSAQAHVTVNPLGPVAPTVVTDAATLVTSTSAQLNGTVTAGNASTTVTFEWGTSISYGNTVGATQSPVVGNTATPVSAAIGSLTPGATYHYRCVGVNSAATTNGNDVSFVATNCPMPASAGTITGPVNVCKTGAGYVYTVPVIADATSYVWTLPTGFTITNTNVNSITVSVSAAAVSGNITVYGSSVCGQGAVSANFPVTVNALPTPAITGNASVCINSTGNVYTTQPGMTGYAWTVSAGGTITAGGTPTSSTVTVSWTTVGAKTVSVNYTSAAGCTAAAPFVYNVTVNPLPVPTLTGGTASVCLGTSGVVFTTEAGMTNYVWAITGGTITAGGTATSNTAAVTWNTVGTQTISVNYTNGNGCTAVAPVVRTITVNALPTPGLLGQSSACLGVAGNVYTTEPGMTNYVWTIPAGGTLTAGGTATSNTATVTWTTAGAKIITVNYSNANGCSAVTATSKTVTVNALPTPVINGPANACVASAGNVYTTDAGMTAYAWTVSAGGTITAGGTATSTSVTVTWTTAGAKTVCVNYTNASGCTAAAAVCYNVNVTAIAQPTITGTSNLCVSSGFYNYTTEPGMTNYVWTVTGGGSITFGQGTNIAQISWNNSGAQTVTVNYTSGGGCNAPSATSFPVTVNPLPGTAGAITGTATVCGGTNGVAYSIPAVNNATSYVWNLPTGASIATGLGTRNITVNFAPNASSGNIVAYGNNVCGNGAPSAPYALTANPLPAPAGNITGPVSVCEGSTNIQFSIATIPGATSYVWNVPAGVTIVSGSTTNTITVNFTASAVSGTVAVHGTNSCGNGGP